MIEQNILTKRYYSIGEVAEMFGVAASLIRYWETEFTSLKPQKNKKGDRRYTAKDIKHLDQIYVLVKEKGYTLEGAKKEISHIKQRQILKNRLLDRLKSLRKEIHGLNIRLGK